MILLLWDIPSTKIIILSCIIAMKITLHFKLSFQDNDNNILKYIDTNFDKAISYGLDFTMYTKIISRWNLYVYNSFFIMIISFLLWKAIMC